MRKIMYEIAHNWGFPLTLIAFIITLIFGVFPNISAIVRIPLFAFSCMIILVFIISKICTYSYIRVPKIVGCTVAEAKIILEKNGLKFLYNFTETNEQEIVKQEPKENCYVKKNSSIFAITRKQAIDEVEKNFSAKFEFKALSVVQINAMGDLLNGYFENIVYYDKSVYSGNYKDGIPNGKGTYRTETFEYNGNFAKFKYKDDLFKVDIHGKGKFIMIKDDDDSDLKVGDSIECNWNAGELLNGHGIIIISGWGKYDGNWLNKKRHGKGVFTWENGNIYDGYWEDGNRHGKGVFTWVNGGIYNGDWKDNKMHGEGVLIWTDGSKYEGTFENDNLHGKGTFTYGKDDEFAGDIIECYYVEDSRNGQGIYKHKNGNYDIGTWKNHEKQGTFLCYNSNGQLLREEIYVDGKLKTDDRKK